MLYIRRSRRRRGRQSSFSHNKNTLCMYARYTIIVDVIIVRCIIIIIIRYLSLSYTYIFLLNDTGRVLRVLRPMYVRAEENNTDTHRLLSFNFIRHERTVTALLRR